MQYKPCECREYWAVLIGWVEGSRISHSSLDFASHPSQNSGAEYSPLPPDRSSFDLLFYKADIFGNHRVKDDYVCLEITETIDVGQLLEFFCCWIDKWPKR